MLQREKFREERILSTILKGSTARRNPLYTSPHCTHAAPATGPNPEITLTAPGGNPASTMSSHILRAESGVCSAVFRTKVQPQARAGAIFHPNMSNGKFHGMIICEEKEEKQRRVSREKKIKDEATRLRRVSNGFDYSHQQLRLVHVYVKDG